MSADAIPPKPSKGAEALAAKGEADPMKLSATQVAEFLSKHWAELEPADLGRRTYPAAFQAQWSMRMSEIAAAIPDTDELYDAFDEDPVFHWFTQFMIRTRSEEQERYKEARTLAKHIMQARQGELFEAVGSDREEAPPLTEEWVKTTWNFKRWMESQRLDPYDRLVPEPLRID